MLTAARVTSPSRSNQLSLLIIPPLNNQSTAPWLPSTEQPLKPNTNSKHTSLREHFAMPSIAKPPVVQLVSLLVSSTEKQHSWLKYGRMGNSYIAANGSCQAKTCDL